MEIKKLFLLLFSFTIFFIPYTTFAGENPLPIGFWKTYDLKHKPRSIIKISLVKGELIGTIQQSLTNDTICTACQGKWKNKPVIGMPILWGLRQTGNKWDDGRVLNIDNGKIYHCYLKISDDNKILYFSPYLGSHWIKVTINWERVG